MLVGGEESKNEKIKQRKNERKKHADKKRDELKMLVEQDVSTATFLARVDSNLSALVSECPLEWKFAGYFSR